MGDTSKKEKGKLPSVAALARSFLGNAKPVQEDAKKEKSQPSPSDQANSKEKSTSPAAENKYENFNMIFSEKVTIKSESKKEGSDTIKTQAIKTQVVANEEKPDEDTVARRNKIFQLRPVSERAKPSPSKQPQYTGLLPGKSSSGQSDPDEEIYDELEDPGYLEPIKPVTELEAARRNLIKRGSVDGRPLPDVPQSPPPAAQRSTSTDEQSFYNEPTDTPDSSKTLDQEDLPVYDKDDMVMVKKDLMTKRLNGSFVLILMNEFAEGDDPYRLIAYSNGVLLDKPIVRKGNKFKVTGSGNKLFRDIKSLVEYYRKNKVPDSNCLLSNPVKNPKKSL